MACQIPLHTEGTVKRRRTMIMVILLAIFGVFDDLSSARCTCEQLLVLAPWTCTRIAVDRNEERLIACSD